MQDARSFRVLRSGREVFRGNVLECRYHAKRYDVIENLETFDQFTWWPELYQPEDHDPKTCPRCSICPPPEELSHAGVA